MDELKDKARQFVAGKEMWLLGALAVLTLILLWKWFKAEGFNPTQTMRFIKLDDTGREMMVGAPAPGSAAWKVLNSKEYGCATRVPAGDDAWSWQMGVATNPNIENMKSSPSDNELSRIAAGGH